MRKKLKQQLAEDWPKIKQAVRQCPLRFAGVMLWIGALILASAGGLVYTLGGERIGVDIATSAALAFLMAFPFFFFAGIFNK